MITKNYYELLWIPIEATPEQIKAAYRKLAKTKHPDRLPFVSVCYPT